jgi:nucleotide-binding universal stress UspA family protein
MSTVSQNRLIIIGALDRTPASDWVVHTASSMAAALPGAELHFLHVVPQPGPTEGASSLRERLQDARTFIDGVAEEIGPRVSGKVAGHIASGAPRRQILQLASDLEADLLVVGSHRKSAPGRWLLGSVSQAIVADAPCAVLVARPKEYVAGPEIEPACPKCLEVQKASHGDTLWCGQHATRHVHGRIHHMMNDAESLGGSSVFIRT